MIIVRYTADAFGRAALDHAIEEAKLRRTGLRVVNSTKGDALADPAFAQSTELRNMQGHLAESGVDFELIQPVGVDPVRELLEEMDSPEAELLVIGIRDRNPVGKLLMGSVSQQLLLECAKPVLAVKPARY